MRIAVFISLISLIFCSNGYAANSPHDDTPLSNGTIAYLRSCDVFTPGILVSVKQLDCPSVADSCDEGNRWRFIVDVPDRDLRLHRIKMYSFVAAPEECIGRVCIVYAHRTSSDGGRLWGNFMVAFQDSTDIWVYERKTDYCGGSRPVFTRLDRFEGLQKLYHPDPRDR